MNLIQQANFLENVPKDQLAQMSQDPNGQFPPFLVLTEIQRRTMNEQNYKAMQQRPTTTVAEEVVGNFMQPQLAQNQSQGLQVGAPQSATQLPDSNISAGLSGVPTAPMQMAASGGLTGYASEGRTYFRNPFKLDKYDPDQDRTALNQSFKNPYSGMELAKILGVTPEQGDKFANMLYSKSPTSTRVKGYEGSGAYEFVEENVGSDILQKYSPKLLKAFPDSPIGSLRARTALFDEILAGKPDEITSDILGGGSSNPIGAPLVGATDISTGIVNKNLEITTPPPVEIPAKAPVLSTNEQLAIDMKNPDFRTPKLDFKYEAPNREALAEIPTDSRDYFKVSDEDRDRELDVFALAGLAQAVGGAKNLAEFGSGVGDVALGLQKVKKGQRADQRAVSDLEFKDAQNKYAMEIARTDIINKAISADSVAEQTMLFNTLKLNLESEGKDADRIILGIRNDALLKQVDATNKTGLKPFVTGYMAELNTLKEKFRPSPEEQTRITYLENLMSAMLFDATSNAGMNLENIIRQSTQQTPDEIPGILTK